jgi:hypothetical protein
MGLHIFKAEVDIPLEFACYDGSGASKVPMDLTDLVAGGGILKIKGKANVALSVVDALGGLLRAIIDGTYFTDDTPHPSQVQLTFTDGSIRQCRTFTITQESGI